jgi:hypothetical protein
MAKRRKDLPAALSRRRIFLQLSPEESSCFERMLFRSYPLRR